MKIAVIDQLLLGAGLEPLNRDELLALAKSESGQAFGQSLRKLERGDSSGARIARLAVLAHHPRIKKACTAWGIVFDQAQLVKLAIQEGDPFFAALEKYSTADNEAHVALAYLTGLGLKRTQPAAARATQEPPYFSFKVFAKSAALCIAEAKTRSGNEHTIQIEGATAVASDGRPSYDWMGKITVQLSVQECYQTLALFERHMTKLNLDGHGVQHDKFVHFSVQEKNYLVRLGQRSRYAVTVPVQPADALRIVSLLYKQILANDTHLTASDLQQIITGMASMMGNITSN